MVEHRRAGKLPASMKQRRGSAAADCRSLQLTSSFDIAGLELFLPL